MNATDLMSNPWALLALPAAMYVALAAAVARRQSWTGEIKLAVAGTGVVLVSVWLISFSALMAFFLAAYVDEPLNALGPVAVDGEMAVGTVVWIAVGQSGVRLAEVRSGRDALAWLLSPRPYVALLVAFSAALSSVANAVHPLTAAAQYHLPPPWSYAASAVPGVVMFAVIHQLVILFRVLRSEPGQTQDRLVEVVDVRPAELPAAGADLTELRSELRSLTERLGMAALAAGMETASTTGQDREGDQASAPESAVVPPPAATAQLTAVMTGGTAEGDHQAAGVPAAANSHDPAMVPVVPRPPAGPVTAHQSVMPATVVLAADRPADGRPGGHEGAAAPAAVRSAADPAALDHAAGHGGGRQPVAAMTAEEAKAAAVRLVRQGRRSGRSVTASDVQRVTGRKARQARRLLAQAVAAVEESPARRPRVLTGQAAAPAAAAREA
jgi:hypothetical protein